jgi:hypothetical protein
MTIPLKLQAAIDDYLGKYPYAKLLTVQQYTDNPYKDKSIINTRYVGFIEHGNLMVTLEYGECNNSQYDWYHGEIRESSMIVGYIQTFIQHSNWFK